MINIGGIVSGLKGGSLTQTQQLLTQNAEIQLDALLRVERIERRVVYCPGEVCRLLRISPITLRQFCELAEHPDNSCRDPRALESFLVGCHHRIAHDALVEWLARNQTCSRE